jgi:hypothetical protein
MFSLTRMALEAFDNQHDFERMCADILNALGYLNVVLMAPRGGSDGGRDITFIADDNKRGLACVTLRKDIDKKFIEDFSQRKVGDYDVYYLFCNTYLTAQQKDKYTRYCLNNLMTEFTPQDVEALRSLLDSTLKDIRWNHLRIGDSNIDTLSEKVEHGFDEVRQNLSVIQASLQELTSLAGPLTALRSPAASKGLPTQQSTSKQKPRNPQYIILGLSDSKVADLLRLFSDEPPSQLDSPDEVEEIYFDDPSEMAAVFESLHKIAAAAKELEKSGVPPQEAFEEAWHEEATSRASTYLVQRFFPTLITTTPATQIPSLEYVIFGLTDHITTIRGLRPKEIAEGSKPLERNATEILFTDMNMIGKIPMILENAVQESHGNSQEYLRVLLEAMVRERLLRSARNK